MTRHPLKPLDIKLLDWYLPTGKPVHCLLTKSDKLSNSERALTLRHVIKQMQAANHNVSAQMFSSLKKEGVDEAEKAIERLFNGQAPSNEKLP